MKLSASQAAKETGKSVPTITRAIKSGKISADKTDTGGFEIDPSELFRVFPRVTPVNDVTPNSLGHETHISGNVLQVEVEMLRQRLAEKDALILDLREDRDQWRQQAQKATHLLTDQRPPKKPWWPFGR